MRHSVNLGVIAESAPQKVLVRRPSKNETPEERERKLRRAYHKLFKQAPFTTRRVFVY